MIAKLRLLFVSQRPLFPVRFSHGGQRSNHELLLALSERGIFECVALGHADQSYHEAYAPKTADYDALSIRNYILGESFATYDCGYKATINFDEDAHMQLVRETMNSFSPDVVVTGQRGFLSIISAISGYRNSIFVSLDTLPGQGVYSIDDLNFINSSRARALTCSEYLKKVVEPYIPGKCSIVYPSFGSVHPRPNRSERKSIGVINPIPAKGGEIIKQLSELFPDEQFLLLEGWEVSAKFSLDTSNLFRNCANVRWCSRTAQIGDFLSQLKLLLVPSQWDEAFGRIAFEAQIFHVPVIASQVGGLPEAVGNAGVFVSDFKEIAAWEYVLRDVLFPDDKLRAIHSRMDIRLQDPPFSPECTVSQFLAALLDDPSTTKETALALAHWLPLLPR